MKFTPKTEEQIKKESNFAPFPRGEYDFEIKSAVDKVSKASGNEMIEINVTIYAPDGASRGIFDYLIPETGMWKVHHAAQACGLVKEYEEGNLEAWMFEGKVGRCKVGISPAKDDYPERNKIVDYIAATLKISEATAKSYGRPPTSRQPSPAHDIDDDIPF